MIDLNALDNDPWSTIPVNKDDLRALASALQSMEADLARVTKDASHFYQALVFISGQDMELRSRNLARRTLGLEPQANTDLIL
ncbi:MAG: hypothetical protein AMJ56_00560 [Anaerolineae bacterium SG8_19]|nr:MAG: hypothetical protein AMJ56_00560 [Anaerolineae bacterium SG8_19]